MVTHIVGTSSVPKTTGNVSSSFQIKSVTDKVIFNLEFDVALFTKLMKMLKRESAVGQRTHYWPERDDIVLRDKISATSSSTTLYVTNYEPFKANSLWMCERTGEVVQVSSDATSTSVTVVRSVGGTPSTTMTTSDYVRCLGTSYAEGETAGTLVTTQKSMPYNYVQDFRTFFDMSDHQQYSDLYGGPDWPQEERFQLKHHMKMIENAIFFGERAARTTTTIPEYDMGGLREFITTNEFDASGTVLTEADFDNICEEWFRYGNQKKVVFCGAKLIRVINSFAKDKLQVVNGASSYGLAMKNYLSPVGGELRLLYYPQVFEGDELSGWAFCLDPQHLALSYYKGFGKTYLKDNTPATTGTKTQKEWRTNLTLERILEKTHGVLKGIA